MAKKGKTPSIEGILKEYQSNIEGSGHIVAFNKADFRSFVENLDFSITVNGKMIVIMNDEDQEIIKGRLYENIPGYAFNENDIENLILGFGYARKERKSLDFEVIDEDGTTILKGRIYKVLKECA